MQAVFKYLFGIDRIQMPLWLVIVVPFVVLIAAAMGLTAWVSLVNGRSAVDELAIELNQRISNSITDHVSAFTERPMQFLQVVTSPYRTGEREPTDLRILERTFFEQLQFESGVDSLYYGNQDGHFVLVKSPNQGLAFVRDDTTSVYRYIYTLDDEGNRVDHIDTQPYDPRGRPWYLSAVEVGEPTWSEVYLFAAEPVLGVTPVVPIRDMKGELRGVFGTDLTLLGIDLFMRRLEISEHGQAFIIERSGAFIATSSAETPFVDTATGRERLFVGQSENHVIASVANAISEDFGGFKSVGTHKRLSYDVDDESYFTQVTEVKANGLDWLVVVAIPGSDFMAPIYANTRFAKLCLAVALLAAVLFGALLARAISRSIGRVAEASLALADGDLDRQVETTTVQEIQELSDTFNRMTDQVRGSIRGLESANRDLAGKVEQGTYSLEMQRERERELAGELDSANQQLELLATTDPVTGLPNRSRFESHLAHEWAQMSRDESALSLIVADFSLLNEDAGTGDDQLSEGLQQQMAQAIQQAAMRPSDLIARCGEHEFIVVLPATSIEGATTVARSISENILQKKLPTGRLADLLGLNVGVATLRPNPSVTSTQLLEMLGDALVAAKKLGSHTIVRFVAPDVLEEVSRVVERSSAASS